MATVFKNARLAVTGSYSTAYTCPTATTAIVLSAQVSNTDSAAPYEVSAQWLDSSASNAATRLAHVITVPAKASMGLLSGKLVLEAGDVFQALASTTAKLELTLSILELS